MKLTFTLLFLVSCLDMGKKVGPKYKVNQCIIHKAEADGVYQITEVMNKNYKYKRVQGEAKELVYPIELVDQNYIDVSCPKH